MIAHADNDFKDLKHYKEESQYVIECNYEKAFNNLKWIFRGDGWVELMYSYRPYGKFDYLGISFNYPEKNVRSITYLGLGPYRVWKNRMDGMELGVWKKEYNNTITGQSWDYPEFKGYHANFHWGRLETTDGPITIISATDNLYLRLFTPGVPDADPRHTKVDFPVGDISFLHAINPIGTKFMSADELGPMGKQNHYTGSELRTPPFEGHLYFYFGDN